MCHFRDYASVRGQDGNGIQTSICLSHHAIAYINLATFTTQWGTGMYALSFTHVTTQSTLLYLIWWTQISESRLGSNLHAALLLSLGAKFNECHGALRLIVDIIRPVESRHLFCYLQIGSRELWYCGLQFHISLFPSKDRRHGPLPVYSEAQMLLQMNKKFWDIAKFTKVVYVT